VDESWERLGFFGALASRLSWLAGLLGCGAEIVGAADMDHEAEQDESNQQKLVKQQVWRHDDVPLHGGEKKRFYRIHLLSNYPLDAGTPPTRPSWQTWIDKHSYIFLENIINISILLPISWTFRTRRGPP
jgi:hypothetical protein